MDDDAFFTGLLCGLHEVKHEIPGINKVLNKYFLFLSLLDMNLSKVQEIVVDMGA